MDTNEIKCLAEIMKNNGVTNLEIESGKLKIKMERATCVGSVSNGNIVNIDNTQVVSTETQVPVDNGKYITSPMVGVFYAAPGPNESPFVKEGSVVKGSDVVCIIEAMKLMNEITAQMSGKIVEILVKNGDVVEYGQKLFRVEAE